MKVNEIIVETKSSFYHVSKSTNRKGILQRGLIPQNKEDLNIRRKPGVFLFQSFDDASEWAYWGKMTYPKEEFDIWRVELPERYHITRDLHPEMTEFSSFVGYDPIPPNNINLINNVA